MKNNTWTIVRKELARFFGDRALFFTTVIMPGLLLYLVYSLMGTSLEDQFAADPDKEVMMYVDNMPACFEESFAALPYVRVDGPVDTASIFAQLRDKENSLIYVNFPAAFDEKVLSGVSDSSACLNVQVYCNSACAESDAARTVVVGLLNAWESERVNLFDVNAPTEDNPMGVYDMASDEDVLGSILSKLVPLLILMLLASGCMAVAPGAIAGEKERGTIATLLITPMRRSQLALGKIISLSFIALLSGLSSFLGVIFSLPKMLQMGDGADLNIPYGLSDYAAILMIILSTVLVMISIVSILSALAKDVKSAGTMLTPFMLLMMALGMSPMFVSDIPAQWMTYLFPIFNSTQCMAAVFARDINMLNCLITVVSNLCYTGVLVWVLAKMFNSERVMFGK